MGRIPGFRASIFPDVAMPELSLVANLGLTLFLFIVGLEVDLRFLISNWKVALSVGLFGMAVPFGMGCAIAVGLYREFKDEPGTVDVNFGIFMLFIGVAMAITVSYFRCCTIPGLYLPNLGFPCALPYLD
jgi:Kef-type K+ transport system membrane component KefB